MPTRPVVRRALVACTVLAAACESRALPDRGWPSYNGDLAGARTSPLAQITAANVAELRPVCRLRVGEEGSFQTGPIVVGDTIYVTTPHSTVAARASTCEVLWRHMDTLPRADVFMVNRGAAIANGRLFRGTPDGRLLALDTHTGAVVWEVAAGDGKIGEFTSSAPIVHDDIVIMGLAGGDWGIKGRVMGYDAATGKERWRFNTIPTGSEPGADSWKIPATAARGGGGTWTTYTLDAANGELFVPVGNPAPDFAPDARPGDNLYSDAIVVLDVKTGALKWWHQVVVNDGYDLDISAAPALGSVGAGPVYFVGAKDGFVRAVDRASHAERWKTAVTTIETPKEAPSATGSKSCPGALGGVEWNGPAYDAVNQRVIVGAVDWCFVVTRKLEKHTPGKMYFGGTLAPVDTARGWLTALDAATGAVQWKFHAPAPIVAGVTPTASGLVFTGDLAGTFYAFDAASGKVLLSQKTEGSIAGGVITYAVGGKQYVALTSGNASRVTFQTAGHPTLVVMALGAPPTPRDVTLPDVPRPKK